MRIGQIILRVADMDESIRFWSTSVGLGMKMEGEDFSFLDGGSIQLTLNRVGERPDDGSLTEIVIEVEDIMDAFAELSSRGVPFQIEPRAVMSDGNRELWATHFVDPDGHLASIVGWVG
ncbi:MAG TPA: VOC family protein [Acidimicrobiia bacterium]|nr:VOC family protein [Acidimicrobiia bacterium]